MKKIGFILASTMCLLSGCVYTQPVVPYSRAHYTVVAPPPPRRYLPPPPRIEYYEEHHHHHHHEPRHYW